MQKPEPLYIAVDACGETLDEQTLQEIEALVRENDGVADPALSCANDSARFAELVSPMDFTDPSTWPFLVILVVSKDGAINGYRPEGRMVKFLERAKPGVSSYELFKDILELP